MRNSIEGLKSKFRGDTVYPFEGQDAMMWTDKSLRHTNLAYSYVRISDETPIRGDALYQDIRLRVKRYIEKNGSKGVCRARWYEPYDRLYTYTDESVDAIVDQLVIRGTDTLDGTALGKLITDVPMRWVIYENSYHAIINHQFVDGCKYAELLSVPMDNPIFDWKIIPEFTYIPGITELVGVGPGIEQILKTLPRIKRNLSVDSDWKVCVAHQHHVSLTHISTIKWIKRYITDKYGKIPYSLVLACVSSWNLLRCTDKKQLTVGIAGAFRDTRATPRFNNFSAILLPVKRPDGFDEMDMVHQFHNVVEQFVEYLPGMKSQMVAMYLATNVYDLKYYANDMIDMLVSCAPTNLLAKYNGIACNLERTVMVGTTMPIYHGWWNSGDKIVNSHLIRSNEIDTSKNVEIDTLMCALKHVDCIY